MISILSSAPRAACALGSLFLLSAAASADVIVVNQFGFSFDPPNITIDVGDTVRWQRNSGSHDVVEGADGTLDGNEAFFGPLDSLNPIFEVTFDAAFIAANPRPGGLYDYFCSPHWVQNMVGSVTVLEQPGDSFCDCSGNNSPCNNSSQPGEGCNNSNGGGSKLIGAGSASASVDDLTFNGSNLIGGQAALLFVGTAQMNGGAGVPFGDGLRCAGGQISRLGVRIPDASGNAHWAAGMNAGLWNAGDTRYFQIWHRDSVGGPCGNQFNVSNGYAITFN